jgi:hypothetical protein
VDRTAVKETTEVNTVKEEEKQEVAKPKVNAWRNPEIAREVIISAAEKNVTIAPTAKVQR